MKRSLFGKTFKKTFLAIPASALMLGSAEAGTTIGLNFQAWYYDSGATPQTVGYGAGYQTTGFPATGAAFGLSSTNWWNTDPITCNGPTAGYATFNGVTNFAGSLSADITAVNAWQTGIGALNNSWVSETVVPGNNEVTWGILDNTGWSVSLAHLNSIFPNGYVVQAISAGNGKVTANSQVIFTDGITFTNGYNFNSIYSVGGSTIGGYEPAAQSVGLSVSTNFTSDTLIISSPGRSVTNLDCSIAGFIFTDKPVVTWMGFSPTNAVPMTNSVLTGTGLTLSSSAFGILPLSYQWQVNGTNIPGATFSNYTNANAAVAGNYQLVVTNLYGVVTSQVATVTILAPASMTWAGNLNSTWDINTTANWTTNGQSTTYLDGSLVIFDDTAANTGVNVATTVSPYIITITNNVKTYTISGSAIAGTPGGLIKGGTNALTLSGANTFTGPIAINGGSLTIADPGVLGGGKYSGVITNNGAFIWASSAAQTNTAAMTGSGSVLLNGSGTLTMAADALVTNGIIVNSGTLQVTANNFGGTFTPRIVINTNGTVIGNSVHALGGGASVFINHGTWVLNDEDYKQNLAMIDGLIAKGTGGDSTYEVRAGNSGGSGSWTWYVSNSIAGSVINADINFVPANSTLTLNVQRGLAASDLTVNGNIKGTGTGNFIFTGNGITMLNGANSSTAGITVNSGLVIVQYGTGSGMTTVNTNGTLLIAPNATVNGSATIGGPFALIPADGIGGIYIGGALSMTPAGVTIMKIAKTGGSPAADNLYVLGTGGVSYNGTLLLTNVTSDGTALAAGDTFQLFNGSSYGGSFINFVLPTLPAGLSWDYSQLTVNGSVTVSTAATAPYFSPAPGNYYTAQTVIINSLTPGATIYYTTDGSTPTAASPHGAAPLSVVVPANKITTINTYAAASGYPNSAIVTGIYSVTSPTWITPSGGSWQTTGNWSNSVIANASGVPADFSQLTLSSAPVVTLDGSPTIGSINFADAGNSYGWMITPGSGSGNTLVLDNGTNTPVINVQNQSVTITNVALSGVGGLTKNGAGTLLLTGTGSTYTGPTVVNGGTLALARNSGGSGSITSTNITVNPGATMMTLAADALGYSGSQWVRIINLNGGLFTNAISGNEGWGLTLNMMGGTLDSGTSGGAIAAGDGTAVNTIATNISSKILGKFALRESNPNGQVTFNVAGGTAGPDLLVNAVISQANGVWGISKTGSGIMSLTATNTYTGLTSVSNGTLLVSGVIASTNIVAGGTLSGAGKLTGPTTIQSGGILQPGLGGGDTSVLTISNKLTLAGNVLIAVNRTNAQNSSGVTGISTLAYGGILTVTNAGNPLQLGDAFNLFGATNYTGNFSVTNLPALTSGLSWAWTPANGTLNVVQTQIVNPNPTNIVTGISGNALTLSWPADHTGWRLLAQTNHLQSGISSNPADWGTVNGSAATNKVIITIDPSSVSGFYRLVYP